MSTPSLGAYARQQQITTALKEAERCATPQGLDVALSIRRLYAFLSRHDAIVIIEALASHVHASPGGSLALLAFARECDFAVAALDDELQADAEHARAEYHADIDARMRNEGIAA